MVVAERTPPGPGGTRSVRDELGSLQAPPGSRDWAIAVADVLRQGLHRAQHDRGDLLAWLDGFIRYQGWQQLADQQGDAFADFDAFCLARAPIGLGADPAVVAELRRQRSPDERWAAEQRLRAEGMGTVAIARVLGVHRDTVRVDAQHAGNPAQVKPPRDPRRQVYVSTRDPRSAARTLRRHFCGPALRDLISALAEPESDA